MCKDLDLGKYCHVNHAFPIYKQSGNLSICLRNNIYTVSKYRGIGLTAIYLKTMSSMRKQVL